jgi:hypothetical protein
MEIEHKDLIPFGYAVGNYSGKCRICNLLLNGVDKRAWSCRPCAEKAYNNYVQHNKHVEIVNTIYNKNVTISFDWREVSGLSRALTKVFALELLAQVSVNTEAVKYSRDWVSAEAPGTWLAITRATCSETKGFAERLLEMANDLTTYPDWQ